MPIDVIGFAIARAEADKRGLDTQESSRIGVIGAVMPNPIMALVVARSMADREAPPPASQPGELPAISLVPRDDTNPDGTGTGTTGTGGTGTGTGTTGTGTTGTGTTGTGPTHQELIKHIDDAKDVAEKAKSAADGAVLAVVSLTTKVGEGFQRIEKLIQKPSSMALSTPMDPQQSTPGKGKGGGDKP